MYLLQMNQTLPLGNRPRRQFSTAACGTTGSILAQRELGHLSNITPGQLDIVAQLYRYFTQLSYCSLPGICPLSCE